MVVHGGLNQDEDSFDETWVLVSLGTKLDRYQSAIWGNEISSGLPELRNRRSQ
jgi:hypothetical protein